MKKSPFDVFILLSILSILLLTSCWCREPVCKEERTGWSFDDDRIGSIPPGWLPAETGGKGTPATWEVVPGAIAITKNPNAGSTYNLLLAKGTRFKNGRIKVRVKAVAGKEDQGGGPIWRAQDANNYYIARWNPLEDNFRVYFVKDGNRTQLGSAEVKTDAEVWHTIEISHRGTRMEAMFDGKKLIEVEDSTFQDGGMVGLWVKADGLTAFDDVMWGNLVKKTR